MSAEVTVLQHVECETIGSIAKSLHARNLSVRFIRLFEGQPVPTLDSSSGLIVMGGPMGVYDYNRFPYLTDEKRLIEAAVRAEKPVLGICLGSQLLAAALGATVKPSGKQEIGWHLVTLASAAQADPLWLEIPTTFTALHWHGDIFDLPAGAELLASSAMTDHQAFRYGKSAYGLLFHLEVTASGIERMAASFPADLDKVGLTRTLLMEQSQIHLPGVRGIGEKVFGRWANMVAGERG